MRVFGGETGIPVEEHVQKVRAACDARVDEGFVVIARTDALAVNGWGDVVERVGAYRRAGADVVFVDGIKTMTDLDNYVELVVKEGLPALCNGALVSASEAERLGFRIQICGSTHRIAYHATRSALLAVKDTGQPPTASLTRATGGLSGEVPPITDVLGLPDVYAREQRYGVGS